MSKLQQQWQGWEQKFIELTQREKVILFLAALFLAGYGLFILLIEPAMAEVERIERQRKNTEGELLSVNSQIVEIERALTLDPNEKIKQEITVIQQQIAELDAELDEVMTEYVAPERMAMALTNLLATANDVRVVGMEVQPPQRVQNEVDEGLPNFFRHQFKVELQGDYFALMQFVARVSDNDSQFNVQNLNYQVVEYPTALMTLTLITVSDNEKVIRL